MKIPKKTKWIIVTGGVLSGLGKGIVTSSLGKLLSTKYSVIPIKCDGYLNVDPGTLNPFEHGEVFVLDDGGEVDMDFGNYERFLNINCSFDMSLTSGKVFQSVLNKERHGDYLGKTVTMIPYVTDEIKNKWFEIANKYNPDFIIIEIGGTVGDLENTLFLEAARQLRLDLSKSSSNSDQIHERIMYVHLVYVPKLKVVGEQKTKPTQQSVKLLQNAGIQPDLIVARSHEELEDKARQKIALFSNLSPNKIISDYDLDNIYQTPIKFMNQGLIEILNKKLDISLSKDSMNEWNYLLSNLLHPKSRVKIGIFGKYTHLKDAYVSILEALKHVTAHTSIKVDYDLIETSDLFDYELTKNLVKQYDGIIIPGGFGKRGVEGKIKAIQAARELKIPFLGLCFGLQLAVIEFARNVCNIRDATSREFDENPKNPVIDLMPDQLKVKNLGATMRLGSYKAILKPGTYVHKIYNASEIYERHRHRYEVNPRYHKILREYGLIFSGMSPDNQLVEFIELKDHPFFIATQAHPEFKSRFNKPAPLFKEFVIKSLKNTLMKFN